MTNFNNKTSNGVKNRIIFDLVLLAAIFYTPWWVVAILSFVGVFLFPQYYEVIVFGFLLDLLYGSRAVTLGGMLGVISAVVIYYAATYARKAVR